MLESILGWMLSSKQLHLSSIELKPHVSICKFFFNASRVGFLSKVCFAFDIFLSSARSVPGEQHNVVITNTRDDADIFDDVGIIGENSILLAIRLLQI